MEKTTNTRIEALPVVETPMQESPKNSFEVAQGSPRTEMRRERSPEKKRRSVSKHHKSRYQWPPKIPKIPHRVWHTRRKKFAVEPPVRKRPEKGENKAVLGLFIGPAREIQKSLTCPEIQALGPFSSAQISWEMPNEERPNLPRCATWPRTANSDSSHPGRNARPAPVNAGRWRPRITGRHVARNDGTRPRPRTYLPRHLPPCRACIPRRSLAPPCTPPS